MQSETTGRPRKRWELTGWQINQLYHRSGLNLWLVNWIVECSDGSFYIEDNQPRGSVVWVLLLRSAPSTGDPFGTDTFSQGSAADR